VNNIKEINNSNENNSNEINNSNENNNDESNNENINNENNNDNQNNKNDDATTTNDNNEDINQNIINSENTSKNIINMDNIETKTIKNSNEINNKNQVLTNEISLLNCYNMQNIENEHNIKGKKFINNKYKKISMGKLLNLSNIENKKDKNEEITDKYTKNICGLFNISHIDNNVFSLKENNTNISIVKELLNTSFSEKILNNGNAPKLLYIYEDGTGIELLRDVDVFNTINEMNINIEKDIIEESLTDNSNGKSITITKELDTHNSHLSPDSKIILYKQLIRYPRLTLADRKQFLDELVYYNNWLETHNIFIENEDSIVDDNYNDREINNEYKNKENSNYDNSERIISNKLIYGVNKEETENAILEKYSELLLRNNIKSKKSKLNSYKNTALEIYPNEVSENQKGRYKILKNIEANEAKGRSVKGILKIDEEIKKSTRESEISPKYLDSFNSSRNSKEDLRKYKRNDEIKKERKNSNTSKFSYSSSISIKKKINGNNKILNDESTNSSLTLYCNKTNDSIINEKNISGKVKKYNNNNLTEENSKKMSEKSLNTETESLDYNIKYKVKSNIDYKITEAGEKGKLKTISTVNISKSLESLFAKATINSNTVNLENLERIYKEKFKYLLNINPKSCEFGVIKENTKYLVKLNVMNRSNNTVRFKIIQPNSKYIKIKYKISPISPGLQTKIIVEVITPETSKQLSLNDIGQLITENEIIKIPISATVLPSQEYENYIRNFN
jgi:hypothetical protein